MRLLDCDPVRQPAHFFATISFGPNFKRQTSGEFMRTVATLWKEEEGQDLIEYVLLVALIALAGLVGFPGLSNQIATIFNNVSACVNSASTNNSAANC